jgi:hypothetical protein
MDNPALKNVDAEFSLLSKIPGVELVVSKLFSFLINFDASASSPGVIVSTQNFPII